MACVSDLVHFMVKQCVVSSEDMVRVISKDEQLIRDLNEIVFGLRLDGVENGHLILVAI